MPRRLPSWLLFCVVFVLAGSWLFAVLNVTGWIDFFFFSQRSADVAFRIEYSDKIHYVAAPFATAGAAVGDRVVAVQGEPFTGYGQEFRQVRGLRAGDGYTFRVQKPDGRMVDVTAPLLPLIAPGPRRSSIVAFALFLQAAFPVFCLGLGTWVLLARPRDANAWWVFFLLQFVQTFFARVEQFSGFPLPFMEIWQDASQTIFPVAALFFGLDFPRRLSWEQRFPWVRWALAVPLLLAQPLDDFELIGRIDAVSWFRPSMVPLFGVVDKMGQSIAIVCISIFCGAVFSKFFNERSQDARRRLRVLVVGSQVGLWPTFLIVIIAMVRHKDFNAAVPFWLLLVSLALFMLFPLSLAYAIIVERAMDLRILLRQGTQYALARGTLIGIRAVLGAALGLLLYRVIVFHDVRAWVVLIPGLLLILLRWGVEKRAQLWIDRRFFRESYAAEQVLSELMVEAGQFTETRPLLETVTRRISETLHVENMVMLLRSGNGFRLQTAMGVDLPSGFLLGDSSESVHAMERRRGPATVYFDRPDDWLLDASPAEREALRELNVEVLLPLPGRGRLMGVMALGPKRSEQPYSKSDLQLLTSVGTQTGLALENSELIATLKVELAQSARMAREVEIAREVQERLFPQSFPQIPGVQVTGACRPAQGVGGDYYDCMITGAGKLGLAIGDVSGKGIAAALLMASLRASLRGQTMQGATNLAQMVSNVNALLYDSSTSNRYATFFFGEYDPATRVIVYVNAGHNPPVLVRTRPDGTFEHHDLTGGGPVVGLVPGATYEQCELPMQPGDLLLLYTDGISEAMNPNDEEWGEDRMVAETERLSRGTAEEVLRGLMIAADRFANGADQHDDMTLMVMKLD